LETCSINALRRVLTDSIPAWLARFKSPGLAVAIVDHCAPVWTATFGFADVTSKRPVTRNTAFPMGSISKTFTAWAIMTLVQEGKVELDAPADSYLKQWHMPASSFDARQVTVRRLLAHTAGVNVGSVLGVSLPARFPTLLELMNGQVKGFEDQKVQVTERPGSRVRYSGGGYEILQLIVEDVTGRSRRAWPLHIGKTARRPFLSCGTRRPGPPDCIPRSTTCRRSSWRTANAPARPPAPVSSPPRPCGE